MLSFFRRIRHLIERLGHRASHAWRTSLQVRVIGTIVSASLTVVLILGFAMISIVAQRLADSKLDIANSRASNCAGTDQRHGLI